LEKLPNQSAGILIGALLPDSARLGEIRFQLKRGGELLMFSELLAVVERDASPERRRQALQPRAGDTTRGPALWLLTMLTRS